MLGAGVEGQVMDGSCACVAGEEQGLSDEMLGPLSIEEEPEPEGGK